MSHSKAKIFQREALNVKPLILFSDLADFAINRWTVYSGPPQHVENGYIIS
jgi:hypothetical protein